MMKPTDFDSLNLPSTADDDLRIGSYIRRESSDEKAAIIGFNSDEGVKRNNGRLGAAASPNLIRSAFYRMTPDPAVWKSYTALLSSVNDYGSIDANSMELADAQIMLGKSVAKTLESGSIPVILGGGHETSYGHFLGYAENNMPVSIINWDAHADVRELKDSKPHSGSPFRQALEHNSGLCQSYTVAGLKRQSLSRAHLDYLKEKIPGRRAAYYFKGELSKRIIGNIYDRAKGNVMVTMDMDALSQSIAPGVSAPNPDGIPLPLWLHAAYCAGITPGVKSFDLVEMNPNYDTDGQTARIAALTLWHFFKGLALRPAVKPSP
ncbi:MAG: formimidoylglutamase [Balneolia bacterium]|nr:formimidoylglutamase [Balneolia bacterium]